VAGEKADRALRFEVLARERFELFASFPQRQREERFAGGIREQIEHDEESRMRGRELLDAARAGWSRS